VEEPSSKVNVLFQANISRLKLPSPEFALQTPAQLLLLMNELAGQSEDMEYLNLAPPWMLSSS
jgi:hypothetical protein